MSEKEFFARRFTMPGDEERWNATYGAYLALQVRDRMRDGHGPPDGELMAGFVEEAREVAWLQHEAWKALQRGS